MLDIDNAARIHTLLHHLSALFARESDQILQEQLGVTFAQYKILTTLATNPATQQRQIAVGLGQTEASVSRQIKLLQRKGLLESRVNPANRREHRTLLTVRGERVTEASRTVLAQFQRQSLAHLSDKQQSALAELLTMVDRPLP